MSNEQLLPCPFCGGEAQYFEQGYPDKTFHAVKCKSCYAIWEGHPTKSGAIEKWNTRTSRPLPAQGEEWIMTEAEAFFPVERSNSGKDNNLEARKIFAAGMLHSLTVSSQREREIAEAAIQWCHDEITPDTDSRFFSHVRFAKAKATYLSRFNTCCTFPNCDCEKYREGTHHHAICKITNKPKSAPINTATEKEGGV